MSPEEYGKLPPKNNWTPEVKRGTASILDGDCYPPILLQHFVVASVHAVKVYGQYGAVLKRYETACRIINHGVTVNKVVVPNKKLDGQRLRLVQRDMLQSWVENLCETFAGDDSDRHYQGDGVAPPVITLDGTESGVPPHAFTDGAEQTADQLYNSMLSEVKAQKELGLYLLSNSDKAKQKMEANLLNNINRVTSGKFFCCLSLSLF